MNQKSNYGCEVLGCEAHPARGDAILRTSPKGEPFRGRCKGHLSAEERPVLAEDEQLARAVQQALSSATRHTKRNEKDGGN